MQHSDFGIPTERTGTGVARALDSSGIAMQVTAALDKGDHEAVALLLKDAEARFPDDDQFRRLATKHQRQSERFARVYSLLKEMGELLDQDCFVQALGAFREAANLSHGFAVLEEASFSAAIEHAEQLESKNWRIGIALLEDAERLNSKLVVRAHLWQELRAAERSEIISYALAETGLAKPADLQQARERVAQALDRYPDDNGLINRLKSIDLSIEEKRKSDERQKFLKKLTDLRNELQTVEDPAQGGKFVRLSETLAMAYSADPEFSSIVEDITQQVISGEKAAAALAQDRVDDCLEECAWVLSRMRHHRLFLKLKEKAEQRELALVDEYSNSAARIKELLSAGHLAEAEKICSQARTKLPQFTDLQELAREIAQRKAEQAKEIEESSGSAKRLVERGELSLHEQQFRAAEQAFANALKLRPDDSGLAGQVLGILHGFAREIAPENAESAGETLQIAERLLPGRPAPADLTEARSSKRQRRRLTGPRSTELACLIRRSPWPKLARRLRHCASKPNAASLRLRMTKKLRRRPLPCSARSRARRWRSIRGSANASSSIPFLWPLVFCW
jgi:tetratricopeptide (TPR) repeat protein